MDIGKGNGTSIALMIFGLVGLAIGLNLLPTIIGSVIPTIAGDVTANNAGLTRTVVSFVPVGFAVGMLGLAFGMVINTGMKSDDDPQFKPVLLIFAIIVLVIGVNLNSTIGSAQATAIAAATGPTTAPCSSLPCITYDDGNFDAAKDVLYVGSTKIGELDSASAGTFDPAVKPFRTSATPTTAQIHAAGTQAAGTLGLTRTVISFVQIGYVVSLLGAAFSLANMSSGGRLTSGAASLVRRGTAFANRRA